MSEEDHVEIEWARDEGETIWPQRFADLLECYLHPSDIISIDGKVSHVIIQIKTVLELARQTTQEEIQNVEQILTNRLRARGFQKVTIYPVYKTRGVSYLAALDITMQKNS